MSYGVVHSGFWTDAKVRAWPDDARMLAIYFITGPHRNILGCSRIPNGYIAEDMGWDAKRLARALATLTDTLFIVRDDDGWTLVLNQLKHDPIKHANHLTGAIKLMRAVPTNSKVYQPTYERLKAAAEAMGKGLDIPSPAPVDQIAAPAPSPSPSPAPSPAPSPTPSAPEGADSPTAPLSAILGEELARGVVDHRRRIRKPLTPYAAKLLAAKFESCPDPPAAAQAMIANGWQGIDPTWMKPKDGKPDLQRRRDLARAFLDLPDSGTGSGGASRDQAPAGETLASVPVEPGGRH